MNVQGQRKNGQYNGIIVRTQHLPAAQRQKVRLSPDQRVIAARAGAQVRLLSAQAGRDFVKLWKKYISEPVIGKVLAAAKDAGRIHQDSFDGDIDDAFDEVDVDPLIEWFAANADRIRLRAIQLQKASLPQIGIKPSAHSGRVQAEMAKSRDEAIRLIENAKRVYAQQVRELFDNPENLGLRVEELRDLLLERADVSNSRAELIARDQTLKQNAAITRAGHEEAGINSYIWSTSLDERVREEHAELEGQVFDYNNPPEPGNPGEDFQCRCVAIPYLAESGEDEEDDDSEE